MKHYDSIIVGSGITGLTAARMLSQNGKKVLLLEKHHTLGGTVARFRMGGAPFEVGFHFTGGFTPKGDGVLDVMLDLLGVHDRIKPIYFPSDASHRMIYPDLNASYTLPSGIEIIRAKLKAEFPRSAGGIDKYFDRFMLVVRSTPTLEISGFDDFPPPLQEDHITLQAVLDDCVSDPVLQSILAGLCMCYGTRPDQVSFATHARVCFGLQETLARVEDGGDAFVDALLDALRKNHVDILTRTTISEFTDIVDRRVNRFVLSNGQEVTADNCILTIHPKHIVEMLANVKLSKAFKSRVEDFEESNGFFTLYGKMDQHLGGPATLVSILPGTDLNKMLTYQGDDHRDGPMMVLRSMEQGSKGPVQTITALEVAFAESTAKWQSTLLKRRPPEYYQYKAQRTESIINRMKAHLPECDDMTLVDSATTLTYRDYLHSPDGSAYGIRQKMGQFNVAGRLPFANMYAAGQSALLPGILGAMTSSFFVCRSILGREIFTQYINGKPCPTSAS